MAKSLRSFASKFAAVLFAALLFVAALFMFTGCETKRPEITVKIQFNGESYTLEYKLYRNMYPQTVAHYIELIEKKFYDGTVIHDYQTNYLVGGGYYYDENVGTDPADDILSKEDEYDALNLSKSVWSDADKTTAYNTVYGEFSANGGFEVTNNPLTNEIGSLGAYYYTPARTAQKVWVKTSRNGDIVKRPYCYNSTTSLFYISNTTTSDENYCTFGVLKNSKSKDAFSDLLAAIEEYTTNLSENSEDEASFTEEKDMTIYDEYWEADGGSYTATFNIPVEPIVITSVRVTKY